MDNIKKASMEDEAGTDQARKLKPVLAEACSILHRYATKLRQRGDVPDEAIAAWVTTARVVEHYIYQTTLKSLQEHPPGSSGPASVSSRPIIRERPLRTKRKPPLPAIAIDVDGTLLLPGDQPNEKLINWMRGKHREGFSLTLWSARGTQHARRIAELFEIVELFDHIVPKPFFVVDDRGWSWTAFTQVVNQLGDDQPPSWVVLPEPVQEAIRNATWSLQCMIGEQSAAGNIIARDRETQDELEAIVNTLTQNLSDQLPQLFQRPTT